MIEQPRSAAYRADEHRCDDADETDHDAAAHADESQTQPADLCPELSNIRVYAREPGIHPVREIVEPLIGPGNAVHIYRVTR